MPSHIHCFLHALNPLSVLRGQLESGGPKPTRLAQQKVASIGKVSLANCAVVWPGLASASSRLSRRLHAEPWQAHTSLFPSVVRRFAMSLESESGKRGISVSLCCPPSCALPDCAPHALPVNAQGPRANRRQPRRQGRGKRRIYQSNRPFSRVGRMNGAVPSCIAPIVQSRAPATI